MRYNKKTKAERKGITISLRVDPGEMKRLKEIQKKTGMSYSQIIRQTVLSGGRPLVGQLVGDVPGHWTKDQAGVWKDGKWKKVVKKAGP